MRSLWLNHCFGPFRAVWYLNFSLLDEVIELCLVDCLVDTEVLLVSLNHFGDFTDTSVIEVLKCFRLCKLVVDFLLQLGRALACHDLLETFL